MPRKAKEDSTETKEKVKEAANKKVADKEKTVKKKATKKASDSKKTDNGSDKKKTVKKEKAIKTVEATDNVKNEAVTESEVEVKTAKEPVLIPEEVVVEKNDSTINEPEKVVSENTANVATGLENYEHSKDVNNANQIRNLIIAACGLLLLLFCFRGVFWKTKTVTLPETSGIQITVPKEWYLSESNTLFELKNGILSPRMSYIESMNISQEVKDKFFADVETYYDHQKLEDENGIVLIEATDDGNIYCFFRYFPEKETIIETDFQGVEMAEALEIWNKMH